MRVRIPLRVAGALVAGAATVTLVASSPAVGKQSPPKEKKQKVTLCHKGKQTITVAPEAVKAHQRHGDALGACPAPVPG